MYIVLKHFCDMQDANRPYKEGDTFPRDGMSVLPSRIKELSTNQNRQGCPLIVEVEEEVPKKARRKAE